MESGLNTYRIHNEDIIKVDGEYSTENRNSIFEKPHFDIRLGGHLSFGHDIELQLEIAYMFRNDRFNSFGIGVGYESYFEFNGDVRTTVSGDFIPITLQWEHRLGDSSTNHYYTRTSLGYGIALNRIDSFSSEFLGGVYGNFAFGKRFVSNSKYGLSVEGTLSYQRAEGRLTPVDLGRQFDQHFIKPGLRVNFAF